MHLDVIVETPNRSIQCLKKKNKSFGAGKNRDKQRNRRVIEKPIFLGKTTICVNNRAS